MNRRSLLVAGTVAGIAVILVDFIFNGVIFAAEDQAAIASLASDPAIVDSPLTLGVILGVDFVLGLVLTWTYAAMRPRFGPGPRTAVLATLQVWGITLLPWTVLTYIGALTWSFWGLQVGVTFASLLAGGLAGGRLYAEPTAGAGAPG